MATIIALDATASATSGASWSHTCTGSDLFLVVAVRSTRSDVSATYNSVSMNELSRLLYNSSSIYLYTFYLLNPATGANTVAISAGVAHNDGGVSVSYTGVASIDSTGNNAENGTGTSFTATMSTVNDNSRVIVSAGTGDAQSAGTGCVQRAQGGGGGSAVGLYDNNANKTPAGSVSETVNINSSQKYAYQIFSIKNKLIADTMTASNGSYTYTGKNVTLARVRTLIASVGSYILTGLSVTLTSIENKWSNRSKNSSTITNRSKNASTFTNQSKSSSTWSNLNKS